jgi:hypothetical protein
MSAPDISGCVLVPLERLRALEALEAGLPALLKQNETEAIERNKQERFAILHAKQKSNPEPNRIRVLANYHKNKEEVNAKRREAYKLKNEATANVISSA